MTTERKYLSYIEAWQRAHEEAERWVDEATEDDCICPTFQPSASRFGWTNRQTCPCHGDREAAIQARAEELMDTPDEPEWEPEENR